MHIVVLSAISLSSVLWSNVLVDQILRRMVGSGMLASMYGVYLAALVYDIFAIACCQKAQKEQRSSKMPKVLAVVGLILFIPFALFFIFVVTIVQFSGGV